MDTSRTAGVDEMSARFVALRSRLATADALGISVIAALFLAAYYPTLVKLVEYWMANDTYSYGVMVPVISGLLIWMKRAQLEGAVVKPSLGLGALVAGAGLVMLLMGRLSSTNLIEEMSVVLTLCGLTLLVFGRRVFRVALFPILYLLAMVPIWDYLTVGLHPFFQQYSATVGVAALKLLGIPVLKEGVFIELPNITLEVAEACSGINYLIAVLCIGIPLAYLFISRWSRRVLIVLVSALVALLSNGLRVAVVSLFAYYGIRGANGDVHGPFALFRSLLISGIGFAAIVTLIFRFADRDVVPSIRRSVRAVPADGAGVAIKLKPAALALALMMLTSCIGFEKTHRITAVPLAAGSGGVPDRIGRWELRRSGSFPSDLEQVNFDDRLSRNYAAPDGTELNVFMGYFRSQEQGRELAGYALRITLTDGERYSYMTGQGERVKDFLTTKGSKTFHVTYWYVLDRHVVSDDYLAKIYTAWESLVHRRSNGGIVVVKAEARPEETLESARYREQDFMRSVLTASRDYFQD